MPPLVATAPSVDLLGSQANSVPDPPRERVSSYHSSQSGPSGPVPRLDPPSPAISSAFDEVVHWRKRFFKIPTGSVGKDFVNLIAAKLRSFVDSAGTNASAMYNLSVLPSLMLQVTHSKSKAKANADHLQRRMALWRGGDLDALLAEGRCLQDTLFRSRPGGRRQGESDRARMFAEHMRKGRVHDALRSLDSGNDDSGVLKIDDMVTLKDGTRSSVRDLLQEKHPERLAASPEVLLSGQPPEVDGIRFDPLTPDLLKSIAEHTEGSAGPSGLDAAAWRRMCLAFKGASTRLCEAMADCARLLATRVIPSEGLIPFLAGRLIALDKKPGVRPIGVGEVLRRIVAKAVLRVAAPDIEKACGFIQKSAGQPAGIEAAVHAVQQIYNDEETDGVLLVDARNAFNSLN